MMFRLMDATSGDDAEVTPDLADRKVFRYSGWKGRTGSMNKRGRKFLSVSLAAMMTLNMLPAGTIYAEETVTEASSESKETQAEAKKPETEASKQETVPTEAATQPETPKTEETKTPETAGETAETTATEPASETTDATQAETTVPASETAASEAEKETAGEHIKTDPEKKAEQPKIVKTELEEKDGKTYVRVYTDSKTYDRLYVGKKEDADKTPVIEGQKEADGCYSFAFPADETKYGQMITVVPGVKEADSWYTDADIYVQMPVKNETLPETPAEEQTEAAGETATAEYAASNENGDAVALAAEESESDAGIKTIYSNSDKNAEDKRGKDYSMFKIVKSTAKRNGDKIHVTVYPAKPSSGSYTYDALYIGDDFDEKNIDTSKIVVGKIENGVQSFEFDIPLSKQGEEVIFVPRNGRTQAYSTRNVLALKIPDFGFQPESESESNAQSEAQEKTITVDNGISAIYGSTDSKKPGQTYSMFKIAKSTAKKTGDKIDITIYVRPASSGSFSYDALYIGNRDDETKEPLVMGTEVEDEQEGKLQKFEFSVPFTGQGQEVTFVPHSASKGTFSVSSVLALKMPEFSEQSESESESESESASESESKSESETGTGTDQSEADVTVEQGGTASKFNDFIVKNSTAKLNGDTLTVTFTVSGTKYNRIYLGKREDAVKTPVIDGTLVNDGADVAFTLTVPAEKQGMYVPITLGKTNGTWLTSGTRNLFIKIPNINKEFKSDSYQNGIYDLYGSAHTGNSVFNIESDSTITVKGDKAIVTIYSGSTSYDKLYLGNVSDSDAVKEANAVEGKLLGDSDPSRPEYRVYTFEIPKSALGTNISFVLRSKSGKWLTKQDSLNLPQFMQKIGDVQDTDQPDQTEETNPTEKPDQTEETNPTEKPDQPSGPSNGIYNTTATTGAAMFKVQNVELTVKNGKMTALITLTGTGYDYLFMGTGAQAAAAGESQWIKYKDEVTYTQDGEQKSGRRYEIPVSALDTPLPVASYSHKNAKWYDRTITISSKNLNKTADLPAENAPANGIYSTTATTGAAMFKVVNAQLTVKNGQIQALITLSGTGYDYLYIGTGAQASAAGQGQWVKWQDEVTYTENGAQKTGRRYVIPVSALGEPITVASHSESHNKWYDRTITFSTADLKKIGDLPADDTQDPNNGGGETETETNNTTNNTTKPKPDKKPDKESKYESDLSGSTSAVNNSTGLADGVYTPDSFSFSGGSGRISISCTKITVTGGKALATIVFNSSYYGYVKANGNKYFPTHSGNTSIFTIPVNLNANTTIIGMTTRMSAAHEITYTIYVGLNAAKNADGKGTTAGNESGNKKLDEQAPDISGLTYQSETKLDYAKYFKLYHYDQDITLLEVDMTQAEKAADGTKAVYAESESETETEAAAATTATATEDGEAVVQTQGEKVSELYQADVVKYLIIPADSTAELPAGIEKEMILVHQPIEAAYVSDDTALATLDELGLLDAVKTVGVEQDTTTVEAVKNGLSDGSITYAGAADDLQYRELVKSKCDFAVLPADILSGDATDAAAKNKLSDAADSFATLDVPMLVDRSSDEETELGKREWIKVYGALFGCSDQTDSLFQKAVDAAK